jgi:hypothetical protein
MLMFQSDHDALGGTTSLISHEGPAAKMLYTCDPSGVIYILLNPVGSPFIVTMVSMAAQLP